MRTPLILVGLAAFSLAVAGSASAQPGPRNASASPAKPSGGLTAFRSDAELRRYLRRLKPEQEAVPIMYPPVMAPPPPPPPSPPPASAPSASAPAPSSVGESLNALPQ